MTARCVFVQFTAERSGSPISGLTVVDTLKQTGMDVVVIFGVEGPLAEDYSARGCDVHWLPHGQWLVGGSRLRRLRRWGREVRATWRFVRLFRRLRPDLVYVNTLMSVAAVLAARLTGIPAIWHVREQFGDAGGEMRSPLGGRPLVRGLVRALPVRILCISKAVKDNVLGPAPCSKARVIPNPLSAALFEHPWSVSAGRAQLGLPKEAFVVGLPGTIRPVKGHEFFLAAAATLVEVDNTYYFAISGSCDDPYGQHIQRRCSAMGIASNVHFVGALSDMRIFYAACDVACVPSQGESFGRTVVEAFAQRRAVVASRVGGIPEVVEEDETGLLVRYGDVPALATAICRLRDDRRLREGIVSKAWVVAKARYHERAFKRELAQILHELPPHAAVRI